MHRANIMERQREAGGYTLHPNGFENERTRHEPRNATSLLGASGTWGQGLHDGRVVPVCGWGVLQRWGVPGTEEGMCGGQVWADVKPTRGRDSLQTEDGRGKQKARISCLQGKD